MVSFVVNGPLVSHGLLKADHKTFPNNNQTANPYKIPAEPDHNNNPQQDGFGGSTNYDHGNNNSNQDDFDGYHPWDNMSVVIPISEFTDTNGTYLCACFGLLDTPMQ